MASNFYLLSDRKGKKADGVSLCCVFEFEDVIVKSLNAKLYSRYDVSSIESSLRETSGNDKNYLFLVGLTIYNISKQLALIKKHTKQFDGIYAYVFDAFMSEDDKNRPDWKKKFSQFFMSIKTITKLYVPFQQSVEEFSSVFSIPVSYVPIAADVLTYGDFKQDKKIDVNGYGRQSEALSIQLSETFNDKSSSRVYHHTDHMHIGVMLDFYAHRRLFWQLLRNTKIALAFDSSFVDPNKRFPFSFVGQRWFENVAAGCVIVGRRPTCQAMDELFPYENSTIELPQSTVEMLPFIESLLEDSHKIQSIGLKNYLYATEHHDWRHRLRDMLNAEKIAPPSKLIEDLNTLSKKRLNF